MSHTTEAERFADIFDEPVGFIETVDQSEFIPDDTSSVEFVQDEFLAVDSFEGVPPAYSADHTSGDSPDDHAVADLARAGHFEPELDNMVSDIDVVATATESTTQSSATPISTSQSDDEAGSQADREVTAPSEPLLSMLHAKLAMALLIGRHLLGTAKALTFAVLSGLVELTQRRNGVKVESATPIVAAEKPQSSSVSVKVKKDGRANGWPMILTGSMAAIALVTLTNGSFESFVADKFSGVSSSAEVQSASSDDPVVMLNNELASARAYAQQHGGSLNGYIINAPLKGAAGGPHLVVTVVVNGTCWSSGITPGYPDNEVRTDPTGQRCNPQRLADVQAQINAQP